MFTPIQTTSSTSLIECQLSILFLTNNNKPFLLLLFRSYLFVLPICLLRGNTFHFMQYFILKAWFKKCMWISFFLLSRHPAKLRVSCNGWCPLLCAQCELLHWLTSVTLRITSASNVNRALKFQWLTHIQGYNVFNWSIFPRRQTMLEFPKEEIRMSSGRSHQNLAKTPFKGNTCKIARTAYVSMKVSEQVFN